MDGDEVVWQRDQMPWPHGACLICSTSPAVTDPPLHSAGFASLSSLLEPAHAIPPKYWLSPKACAGILRRATARGKALPDVLRVALEAVASPSQSER